MFSKPSDSLNMKGKVYTMEPVNKLYNLNDGGQNTVKQESSYRIIELSYWDNPFDPIPENFV
uniref:Uncharacterized protein n=1 Tax=Arundo donax TaxID=35708 RepID=A0A0A9BDH8_ARUDO